MVRRVVEMMQKQVSVRYSEAQELKIKLGRREEELATVTLAYSIAQHK